METGPYTTIRYDIRSDGVAVVTLDRIDRHNAFNDAMCQELSAVWKAARLNDAVRCLVLTGGGEKAFCTGLDRAVMDDEEVRFNPFTYDDPGQLLGPKSNECWKPVIAAVNGIACGGAFYLLGQADVILAAEEATFFDPHVTYGMPAVYEPILMMRQMPFSEVLRMTLVGAHERISARRALEIGLVTEVAPRSELMERATWLAAAIASQPPVAVQASLRAVWAALELSRSQALELGNTFLNLGVQPDVMADGHDTFRSGTRIEPRIR
jgi:enoyl-CoA hydratase/carnithine racemase